MNTIDIMIGFIIGVGVERALKLSDALAKLIRKAKDARRKENERKRKLLEQSKSEN